MLEALIYWLIGFGAIFAVVFAGAISYVAELRDAHEKTGKPIETLFNWYSCCATVAIAGWVGAGGLVGAYVAIDLFSDKLTGLNHFAVSAIIGALLSFLNRATIKIARHRIPGIMDSYLKQNGNGNDTNSK